MFASSGGFCTDPGKVTKKYRLYHIFLYVWTKLLWINMLMIILVTSSSYSYRGKA